MLLAKILRYVIIYALRFHILKLRPLCLCSLARLIKENGLWEIRISGRLEATEKISCRGS